MNQNQNQNLNCRMRTIFLNNDHQETQLQAEAIQTMLCSSLTPMDTPNRHQNCANVATFAQGILATNILHDQLVDYMWDSYFEKTQQNDRNKHARTQLQKGEVGYAHDVDCNVAGAEDRTKAWKSLDLSSDQKLYRLKFSSSVLPQLILRTKQRKQKADQNAVNTLPRMTRREEKDTKEKDNSEDNS